MEIDLRALESNYRFLRSLLPADAFFCPLIKANAYGHGDIEVAKRLRTAGCTHYGVALLEEAIGLRESGDTGKILVFGLFDPASAHVIFDFGLTPVVSEWHQLEALEKIAVARNVGAVEIHIKFNTGMNRLGFDVDQAPGLRKWLDTHKRFKLEGICTHLLRGDDAGAPGGESESQMKAFAEALAPFKGLGAKAHALNSSGTANLWKRVLDHKDLGGAFWPLGARPGISLYGIQPSNDEGARLNLKPVLSLKTKIVTMHRLQTGDRLSYNATWRASKPSLIAVLPIGYADGYMRLLSNKASVLCRGRRAPVAGTVCMDYIMVDLTEVEAATGPIGVGEDIVLIGEQGSERILAQELADLVGTIPYEILTGMGARIPRKYVDGK